MDLSPSGDLHPSQLPLSWRASHLPPWAPQAAPRRRPTPRPARLAQVPASQWCSSLQRPTDRFEPECCRWVLRVRLVGCWQVHESIDTDKLPPGLQVTSPNQGSDDMLDSDANPVSGQLPLTALSTGELNTTLDIGLSWSGSPAPAPKPAPPVRRPTRSRTTNYGTQGDV